MQIEHVRAAENAMPAPQNVSSLHLSLPFSFHRDHKLFLLLVISNGRLIALHYNYRGTGVSTEDLFKNFPKSNETLSRVVQ